MADVGRPTVMTEYVISKLEEGFLMSFTDREACLYAGINPSTLYDYCKENPEFAERKELLKEQVSLNAKKNLTGDINKGNNSPSQWWLERRNSEFKPKSEIEGKGSFTIEVIDYKQHAPADETPNPV